MADVAAALEELSCVLTTRFADEDLTAVAGRSPLGVPCLVADVVLFALIVISASANAMYAFMTLCVQFANCPRFFNSFSAAWTMAADSLLRYFPTYPRRGKYSNRSAHVRQSAHRPYWFDP